MRSLRVGSLNAKNALGAPRRIMYILLHDSVSDRFGFRLHLVSDGISHADMGLYEPRTLAQNIVQSLSAPSNEGMILFWDVDIYVDALDVYAMLEQHGFGSIILPSGLLREIDE